MRKHHGHLVISLDFELFWGMSDKKTLEEYGPNVLGARTAIPRMLKLFETFGIHATWGTIGMLMARSRDELLAHLPPSPLRPNYDNPRLSTYHHIEQDGIGTSEVDDPYHFGSSLVSLIKKTPHQEIANHTFSHYYALDGYGNSDAVLRADLQAHQAVCSHYDITTESIIFPRNQASEAALRVCAEMGMRSYRGNEEHVLYRARKDDAQSLLIRGLRFVDHYVNLSGHHTYRLPVRQSGVPLNIPSSRFFRPYMPQLSLLEPLRLQRIKRAMTHAARNSEVFHLWWHPHNFGIHQEENFKNLEVLLRHFERLRSEYNMESSSMREIATIADAQAA